MRVAVVGTGFIGQAWAIVFARAGCEVFLWDADPAALNASLHAIAARLQELEKHDLIDAANARGRIQACDTLEHAVADAEYVQENLPEILDVKIDAFGELDRLAPNNAVLASSSSGLPISSFAAKLRGRERCLVAHPVNPLYLLPVVEVCGAPWTSPEVLERTCAMLERVGQRPVMVKRELPGFVLNRLQAALLREAFWLVDNGYVDVEGLDRTVKEGLGPRWALMGPFETIDLNAPGGLDDYCERYGAMHLSFGRDERPQSGVGWPAHLVQQVNAARSVILPRAELNARRAWRDSQLMKLAVHKLNQEPCSEGSTERKGT
jgi:3-hydroxyacyl-CoA dehydrogenase